jgi:Bacterial Ig-like domain (group 3)/FG-GAP-like repeat
MKCLRFGSLFIILTLVLVSVQFNTVARANQPSVHSVSQGFRVDAVATQFTLFTPTRIFGKPAAYDSGGSTADSVAVADVNGDGKPDVVVGNGSSRVSVLLGNGDGTLQSPVSYNLGNVFVTSIAIGDVNGDAHPDLIVSTYFEISNQNNGGVAVLLGRGDGTFGAPANFSSGGYEAISVAISDVNGDGHPDLIAANQCLSSMDCGISSGSVGVLLGNGGGSFEAPVSYYSGLDTQWMAVADVNGDGAPDVIAAGAGDTVGVLLGNGDGTFQPLVTYKPGGFSFAFAVGDVNGDGRPDIVQAVICPFGCPSGAVSVLLGNGDGTFQSPILSSLPLEDNFSSVAIKDLDGDGKLDVVVLGYGGAKAWALLGNGDGTFQAPQKYLSGMKHLLSLAIADLNADGKPDLVMAGVCGTKCIGPDINLEVLANIFDAPTATILTSSPNPSVVNQSVTFTATVTSNPPIPDGEVITFSAGTNHLGSAATKNGVAIFATPFSKANMYTIRARYPGDLFHKISSSTVKQLVNP